MHRRGLSLGALEVRHLGGDARRIPPRRAPPPAPCSRPCAPPPTRPPPRTGDAALERSDCVGALREAAGADHGDGVAEIALAHLLELWGMGLVGDAAALGPRLLVRD